MVENIFPFKYCSLNVFTVVFIASQLKYKTSGCLLNLINRSSKFCV